MAAASAAGVGVITFAADEPANRHFVRGESSRLMRPPPSDHPPHIPTRERAVVARRGENPPVRAEGAGFDRGGVTQ